MRRFAILVLAVASAGGFALTAAAQTFTLPSASRRVDFTNVKDGQTEPTTFTVKFGLVG
jgi:hypothetical protein